MADVAMRFALLAMATGAILAPLATVAAGRRAIEAVCREVGSSPLAIACCAVMAATWWKIYLDGLRLGWWAAIADALAGRF